jgi:hypothetical protein
LKGLMRNNPQSVSWNDQTTQVEWAMDVDMFPVENSRIVLRIHFLPNTAQARHSLLGAYHEQGISLSWISQIWPEENYPKWMEAKWTDHPDPHVKSAVRRTFKRIKKGIAYQRQFSDTRSDSAVGFSGKHLGKSYLEVGYGITIDRLLQISDDKICTHQTRQGEIRPASNLLVCSHCILLIPHILT